MNPDTGTDQASSSSEPAALGMNAGWIEVLRERYEINPSYVDPEWAAFFRSEGEAAPGAAAPVPVPSPAISSPAAPSAPATPVASSPAAPSVPGTTIASNSAAPSLPATPVASNSATPSSGPPPIDEEYQAKNARVLRMIHAFRARGHRIAKTDPLESRPTYFPEVDHQYWGFDDSDMDREFFTGGLHGGERQTLRQILDLLRDTYTRSIAVEFTHIQDPDRKNWLIDQMETTRNTTQFTPSERIDILHKLAEAELFEIFVHTKFIGQKRFSLEGGESLIAMLDELIDLAESHGIREYVLGMAHRGRLNVLCNILQKSKESIFSEFEDISEEAPFGSGDVKYHKGFSSDRFTEGGYRVHLSLTSNPSHLEAVNPVVEGRTRAKQSRNEDWTGQWTVPVLVHGDAAFAGQGIVAETLNLSQLQGYFTGGTVHIVVDNQIGFTTTPAEARSSLYATDVAKMIQVPIFHVNGNDPEAVLHVIRLALAYRQRFHSDVVITLVCYRKHGHNEGDEPVFTQPLLYGIIKEMPSVRKLYTARLIEEGVLTEADAQAVEREHRAKFDHALDSIKSQPPIPDEPYEPRGEWEGFSRSVPDEKVDTSVTKSNLTRLLDAALHWPDTLRVHPKLQKLFEKRKQALREGAGLDWAFGEILAYAALLEDGYSVRVSGQDSSRGTFSHRHAVVVDQVTGAEYTPLAHLTDKGKFEVYDSLLSEAAVLGFEYGYSLADPQTLVIWEAQFGDFVNGAQVIIDQFIASAHVKWGRMSGLVMFLPHGYEGQGPEHSSARIERFLQLCAEDNLQVANCTTPAQIFHLLRRQMLRQFRAPLIVFTPKSLLRHPKAVSRVEEFTNAGFHRVLDDPRFVGLPGLEAAPVADADRLDASAVQRIVFCSGKVYYDLIAGIETKTKRDDLDPASVAVIRLEQIYPWPVAEIEAILDRYPNACEFYWLQEEPKNSGAWFFVEPRFEELLQEFELRYVGRKPAASPAVGSARIHHREQMRIVATALDALPIAKVPEL